MNLVTMLQNLQRLENIFFKGGKETCLFSAESRPDPRPTQWVPGAPSSRIKCPRHETDHSRPYRAEVKNAGVIPRLPHVFMV
jgi:hypothetical protein